MQAKIQQCDNGSNPRIHSVSRLVHMIHAGGASGEHLVHGSLVHVEFHPDMDLGNRLAEIHEQALGLRHAASSLKILYHMRSLQNLIHLLMIRRSNDGSGGGLRGYGGLGGGDNGTNWQLKEHQVTLMDGPWSCIDLYVPASSGRVPWLFGASNPVTTIGQALDKLLEHSALSEEASFTDELLDTEELHELCDRILLCVESWLWVWFGIRSNRYTSDQVNIQNESIETEKAGGNTVQALVRLVPRKRDEHGYGVSNVDTRPWLLEMDLISDVE